MRRTVVDDCFGVRWTGRAHNDRHLPLDSDVDRRRRVSTLRAQPAPALDPRPGVLPLADAWSDSDGGGWAVPRFAPAALSGLSAPGPLVGAIRQGLRLDPGRMPSPS